VIYHKIVNDISGLKNYDAIAEGLEDPIIFKINNELWLSCTSLQSNQTSLPQINICKLNKDKDICLRCPIESPLSTPEKNWLPFISEDCKINFFRCGYGSSQPFSIESVGLPQSSGYLKTERRLIEYDLDLSRFKGSAGPVQYGENKYLFMVHESVVKPRETPTYYYNRFIVTDKTFKIMAMTLPWKFSDLNLEFCRSMILSGEGKLLCTVSINDNESWVYIISLDYVKENLKDINFFKLT
jgi:hypothetical protein